jgi:hypothetical protein
MTVPLDHSKKKQTGQLIGNSNPVQSRQSSFSSPTNTGMAEVGQSTTESESIREIRSQKRVDSLQNQPKAHSQL